MKASDYIVEFLIKKGIKDVFGYPGGMITHLMDSFSKYSRNITAHATYHEQAAAFAACGYAQASGSIGAVYATSGPGATNLITGICNAYFDSIPVIFITGQVNTFELKNEYHVRQRGFQETDIVEMVKSVTKFAVRIEDAEKLDEYLEEAYYQAVSGRKGPVLLDIPMNIFREEICFDKTERNICLGKMFKEESIKPIISALDISKKPVIIVGNGIKQSNSSDKLRTFLEKSKIPAVTTMLCTDLVSEKHYGFIGAYGARTANFILAKSDLIISLGARLDVRQVGAQRNMFAPNAKIIRVDIDENEFSYKVHEDEVQICADVKDVLKYLSNNNCFKDYSEWISVCEYIHKRLNHIDDRLPNMLVERIGSVIPENSTITTDVGQNQVWVAQSLKTKNSQRIFTSGGHGAMGYSLPAAIGCSLATGGVVISFNGDGGIQMNIQELQTVARERLPIKIIIFNNNSLGMIRHFQEIYFEKNYYQTITGNGYTVPNFEALSKAYEIPYYLIKNLDDIDENLLEINGPQLIEVLIEEETYVFPKLEFGKPNQDQEPLLDRDLYQELMDIDIEKN